MKCIMYISEVQELPDGIKVPLGLARIYTHSQKSNREHSVSGLLSYKTGKYIQVLEGEDAPIDRLYQNIVCDDRHYNVTKLLDESTDIRFFPGWNMKLSIAVERTPEFVDFVNHFQKTLNQLPERQQTCFSHFYQIQGDGIESADPQQPELEFQARRFNLSGWPDFNRTAPTPELIVLCSKLTSRSYTLRELVNQDLNEQGRLKNNLMALAKTGLLNIYSLPAAETNPVQRYHTVPAKQGRRFFEKMKHFLGLEKS